MLDIGEFDLDEAFEFLEKGTTRARRRAINASKARRKRKLSRSIYAIDWYKNLHQYSKNKIHCSCNLCRYRPTWDPDNKPLQDLRRLDAMKSSLLDFD